MNMIFVRQKGDLPCQVLIVNTRKVSNTGMATTAKAKTGALEMITP